MIVLDTQVLIWWVNSSPQLSAKAKRVILHAMNDESIAISAMTVWEICLLVSKEKIQLKLDFDGWLTKVLSLPILQVISVDAEIAKASVFLPKPFHKDPADRIIVATALTLGVSLVTSDQKIRHSRIVSTIW